MLDFKVRKARVDEADKEKKIKKPLRYSEISKATEIL